MDLKRQLKTGCDYDGENAVWISGEFVESGEGEGGSFTRTSLRVDDNTFASDDWGNGEGLDLGRFVILDFLA